MSSAMFFGPTVTLYLVPFLFEIQTMSPHLNRSSSFIFRIVGVISPAKMYKTSGVPIPVPQVATELVLQIGTLTLS